MRAILFGAGGGGKRLYEEVKERYEVVAFTDNDARKWGKQIFGIPIYSPKECINKLEYEYLIITSAPGLETIKEQCIKMGILEDKIITSYVEAPLEGRRIFLKNLARLMENCEPETACAEAGVFEGDFAKFINAYFPARKLHLFDTFEGFDGKDVEKETGYSEARVGEYNNTSVELVMRKMPFPEQCIVHKGYFPETASGINDKFCFVNLDLDLYEPTYNGLQLFADKMIEDGVILIHDYFAENFKGPKNAVDKFIKESKYKLQKLPIGDGISVAVVGFKQNVKS